MVEKEWVYLFGSVFVPDGTAVLRLRPYERLSNVAVTGDLVIQMEDYTQVTGCDFVGHVRIECRDPAKGIQVVGVSIKTPEGDA